MVGIRRYLSTGYTTTENNSPSLWVLGKRWGGSKYLKSGMPDMHIVVNNISIEVELKAPNGKPSELQIQKLNQINTAGCIGFVLYPKDFDKFKNLILNIKSKPNQFTQLVSQSGLVNGWK